jgi:molybdate transport system permease protein
MQWTPTPEEWTALATSLVVGARAVAVALPLALAAALALSRGRFVGRAVLDALVHAPLVLPPVVVGYVLLLLFGVQGPVGGLLDRWFGIRLAFTSEAASFAAGVMAFPLMVRAIRLSLEAVDRRLDEAARSLGASPLDRLFSVTLPLSLPGVFAAAIVGFAACLGEFGAVITFAANVPGETQTLPLAIYAALQAPGGEAAATRLSALAFGLAVAALALSEAVARRSARWMGGG